MINLSPSPLRRLLILLTTAGGGIAAVVAGALLLGNHFSDAPAVAAPVEAPTAPVTSTLPPAALAIEKGFTGGIRPLINKYCADCHLNGKTKGDIALDRFTTLAGVQSDAVLWQKLADAVGQKVMPPKKRDVQPTDDERKQVVAWVKQALDWCDCSGPRDPGRVVIHRLNRNEYNNTVRDLLGVDDLKLSSEFPADDTGYGFDNIADVLTMSPLLAEKYLAAAEAALDKAVPAADVVKSETTKFLAAQMEASRSGFNPGDRGSRNLFSSGELFRQVDFPGTGRYEIRASAGADQAGSEAAKMMIKLDGKALQTFDVPDPNGAPGTFKLSTQVERGKHKLTAAFINDFYDPKNPDPKKRDRNLIIYGIEIEGPFDAVQPEAIATQQKLLFAKPGKDGTEEECAAKILEKFATRAYRRPVSQEEVVKLVELYKNVHQQEGTFEKGIKVPMAAVLVSPIFLFRIEKEQEGNKPYAIANNELATRLSYFLWSSIPDEELSAKTASGKLKEPAVLASEVRRMLADRKAEAFVGNFTGQWLELRNLDEHVVDRKRFSEFNEDLRRDMKREVELFFANLIREDRSILELVSADYSFMNDRLAKFYGIPNVQGGDFRKVNLAGSHRGGMLTMGGVLTVTAMPTRTSPVKRGKFILGQFLGMEPPPPPANVPSLSEKPQDASKGTLRQRFEQHREDPTCFSCHARMDPIGFAMENFDAIGRWRDKDGAFPLDTVGTLPGGQTFNGPDELRNVLLEYKQDFVKTLAEKMLTYALGRGLESYDRCTVKDICAAVEKNNYKFSSVIDAIVASDAFQKRRDG